MKEDKIIKQWFKELPEEAPSSHFTDSIMNQVEPIRQIAYRPLISKNVWAIILVSFVSLAIFFGYQETNEKHLPGPLLDYSQINVKELLNIFEFGSFTSPVISLSIAAVLTLFTFFLIIHGVKIGQFYSKDIFYNK